MGDVDEGPTPRPNNSNEEEQGNKHLTASSALGNKTGSRTPSPTRSVELTRRNNRNLATPGMDAEAPRVAVFDTNAVDVDVYQNRKTLAQGLMDLALLSANGNQLRYVLESGSRHPFYWVALVFITMSLLFQVAVGVGLILNTRYNVNDEKERCKANKINNYVTVGIFCITVVNVFISVFGVADPPVTPTPTTTPVPPPPTLNVSGS